MKNETTIPTVSVLKILSQRFTFRKPLLSKFKISFSLKPHSGPTKIFMLFSKIISFIFFDFSLFV
jgi:hypothetical protein